MAGFNAVKAHLISEQARLERELGVVKKAVEALSTSQGPDAAALRVTVQAAGGAAGTWDGNGP